MTEIRNSKYVWVIEYWNLRFICNLVLEIWDFGIRLLGCENTEPSLIVYSSIHFVLRDCSF